VLKLRRSDVRDGFLHVEQNKTGSKLRIAVEGELATLIAELMAPPARSLFLVGTAKGRPITAGSLRTRFGGHGYEANRIASNSSGAK
jgi:hypothetical protein